MHIACRLSSTKCLDEILRFTALRNIRRIAQLRNNDGLSCVHIAVRHGNRDALRKLRSMGVDMNMQVDMGCVLMFSLCSNSGIPSVCGVYVYPFTILVRDSPGCSVSSCLHTHTQV